MAMNVFKKCGKGKHKRLGFRTYPACVAAGGKKGGRSRRTTSGTSRRKRGGVLINGKRYTRTTGKVCMTRKQMARKRMTVRKAINRTFK
jgi:hypothetical protein